MYFNTDRSRKLNQYEYTNGSVVYWMNREHRVEHNWSLIYALNEANSRKVALSVVFVLSDHPFYYTSRYFNFMKDGLLEVEVKLRELGVGFLVRCGDKANVLSDFVEESGAGLLVSDFSPLRELQRIKKDIVDSLRIPWIEVDAHNIVPCWLASDKEEYSAYTFRKKMNKIIPVYLDAFPDKLEVSVRQSIAKTLNWDSFAEKIELDDSVKPVKHQSSGSKAAISQMEGFANISLHRYATKRNDPNENAVSGLSPYINFGHISVQYIVSEIMKSAGDDENTKAFIEELVIRRELTDNFCYYNKDYDNFNGFRSWAQKTLLKYKDYEREYIYTFTEFEKAITHDELWNSAQKEMISTGKMHGYMRMYWAKKILEWSHSAEEAMGIACCLNDRYCLDGKSANGYVGCAWSIGGVHDRPWGERPVFGMIRYMNYAGCKRKFNVNAYIAKMNTSGLANKRKLF